MQATLYFVVLNMFFFLFIRLLIIFHHYFYFANSSNTSAGFLFFFLLSRPSFLPSSYFFSSLKPLPGYAPFFNFLFRKPTSSTLFMQQKVVGFLGFFFFSCFSYMSLFCILFFPDFHFLLSRFFFFSFLSLK